MKRHLMLIRSLVAATIVLAPIASFAQHDLNEHRPPAATQAHVDFGVLPVGPLGPPPCVQANPVPPATGPTIGGQLDPCAYKIHILTPEETTIRKGGEVTFEMHGAAHSIAIYRVAWNTTRDEIGQFLCPGDDPADRPDFHPCLSAGTSNAAAEHVVYDGKGDVVIVAAPNVTNVHPDNRVWFTPGRLMSAGGQQPLNGGTIPAGATSNGQLQTYQFLKTGRYLVICMQRSHFFNDWMFGFVNVTDED
jgi:plastocyanin